jgi:hypothetical protein
LRIATFSRAASSVFAIFPSRAPSVSTFRRTSRRPTSLIPPR